MTGIWRQRSLPGALDPSAPSSAETDVGAADQRAVDAFRKILRGRNAEAARNYVDVGGRVAHFDAVYGFLRRMLVANIIDLGKPPYAFVLPHAVEKIMSDCLGAEINGH